MLTFAPQFVNTSLLSSVAFATRLWIVSQECLACIIVLIVVCESCSFTMRRLNGSCVQSRLCDVILATQRMVIKGIWLLTVANSFANNVGRVLLVCRDHNWYVHSHGHCSACNEVVLISSTVDLLGRFRRC